MDKIIIAFIFTTLLISCNNPIVDLGDGYEYNSECHHIISDHFDIPPYVIEYKFDGNYIIVKQKPTHYFNGIYDYPKEFRNRFGRDNHFRQRKLQRYRLLQSQYDLL